MLETTFPLVFLAVAGQLTLDQERRAKKSRLEAAAGSAFGRAAPKKPKPKIKPMPFLVKRRF